MGELLLEAVNMPRSPRIAYHINEDWLQEQNPLADPLRSFKGGITGESFYRMNTRLVIDKAGRVVILELLREELQLEPGEHAGSGKHRRADHPSSGPRHRSNERIRSLGLPFRREPLPASTTDDMLDMLRNE